MNFVESGIVPQLLRKEGWVCIKEHLERMLEMRDGKIPSQVSCLYLLWR